MPELFWKIGALFDPCKIPTEIDGDFAIFSASSTSIHAISSRSCLILNHEVSQSSARVRGAAVVLTIALETRAHPRWYSWFSGYFFNRILVVYL